MSKPFTEWVVLPHSQLRAIDDRILTVTGIVKMPLGAFPRRMSVVRLTDGRLVVFSAIALDEVEMKALESHGRVAFLIVPSDRHRLDVKPWKERYPDIQVITPPAARAKVEELVPVDATTIDFGDPAVRYFTVEGTNDREAALLVQGNSGTTLILNEVIFNVADGPGFRGWLFKLLGMTGDEPHIPPAIKMHDVGDKKAFADQLRRWSHVPELTRILVSHGEVIDHDAAAVLRRVADEAAA